MLITFKSRAFIDSYKLAQPVVLWSVIMPVWWNASYVNYCKTLLTVEHILTSCSAYKNIREKHYSNSQLQHILTNISKHHIFNYLSEINFFLTNFNFPYGTIWPVCAESAVKPQPTNQPMLADCVTLQGRCRPTQTCITVLRVLPSSWTR